MMMRHVTMKVEAEKEIRGHEVGPGLGARDINLTLDDT
jgi:hypothetical protein